MTPVCIQALYQVSPTDKANPTKVLGLYEEDFLGYTYSQESLDDFFANFTPYIPQGTHPDVASIDGGITPPLITNTSNPFVDSLEAELDIQIAYPLIYPQKITVFQVSDPVQALPKTIVEFNKLLDAIDGVSLSSKLLTEANLDISYSLIPRIRHTAKLEMALIKILPIRILCPAATMEHFNVAYSSLQISFHFHMEFKRVICQPTYQQRQCNEYSFLLVIRNPPSPPPPKRRNINWFPSGL